MHLWYGDVNMINKICRICQNTDRWKHPTGNKHNENKNAYTAKYGFGFEEWLNREEWSLSGYKNIDHEWHYVHIQGMLTKNNAYEGQDANILFYVKEPSKKPVAVAFLEQAHVLDAQEARWAAKQFIKNGWLHLMHAEVKAIGGNPQGLPPLPDTGDELIWENPLFYVNVRFRPGSLHFFETRKLLHIPAYYYAKALDWDGNLPSEDYPIAAVSVPPIDKTSSKELARFSEELRIRRVEAGKPFFPRQAPIQNALAKQLDGFFRPKNGKVTCEDERVDIKLVAPDSSITFIEIKPASSAREAIRLALGQLLEYAHYSNANKANRLVIVSDAKPNTEDIAYLTHLKTLYDIPIRYVYWPPSTKKLPVERMSDFV